MPVAAELKSSSVEAFEFSSSQGLQRTPSKTWQGNAFVDYAPMQERIPDAARFGELIKVFTSLRVRASA